MCPEVLSESIFEWVNYDESIEEGNSDLRLRSSCKFLLLKLSGIYHF